mmetsp:Transcript_18539/g.37767  ORF Transcript_18539/g.37767 Transcript_18539/m.37767 type:complete len:518 (-) Transcript_18539:224-1777(-)
MIHQAQFLAIAGRIGGPSGQPESSQALSEGMGWANYHLFELHGSSEDGGRRRELETELEYSCRLARESPRELGSTVIMAVAATAGSFFGREAMVRLLWWNRTRKGLEAGPAALPFPSWEIQVLLTQFQGLGESAGDAIASGCFPYEFGGGVVILLLLLTLTFLVLVCYYGIRRGHAKWTHFTVREAMQKARELLDEGKGRSLSTKLAKLNMAIEVLVMRGEWEQEDHPHRQDVLHTSFVDRFGALFDSHHHQAWWFGFWDLFRALAVGVVLAAVLDARGNAGAMLGIGCFDFLLQVTLHPFGDWRDLLKNVYRGMLNVAVVSSVVARIDGVMPDNVYSVVFQLAGIVTMVPLILTALVGPVINLFSTIKTCFSSFATVGVTPGALGAAAGVGAVAGAGFDRDAIIEHTQDTRDEAKEKKLASAAAAQTAGWVQAGDTLKGQEDVRDVRDKGRNQLSSHGRLGGYPASGSSIQECIVWTQGPTQHMANGVQPVPALAGGREGQAPPVNVAHMVFVGRA